VPSRREPRRPHVEILYFASCPNYQRVRTHVERAAAELGVEARIDLVEVTDADTAVEQRFLGSPTIRVDGRDIEPGADARSDFALGCRLYRVGGSRVETPDPNWIVAALAADPGTLRR
jgi:hypothetical protein